VAVQTERLLFVGAFARRLLKMAQIPQVTLCLPFLYASLAALRTRDVAGAASGRTWGTNGVHTPADISRVTHATSSGARIIARRSIFGPLWQPAKIRTLDGTRALEVISMTLR